MTEDAIISYSGRVDSLIRSETASILGESPLYTFASRVDRAIRSSSSSSEANFVTSPLHTYPRLFTLPELVAATNNFSLENRIAAGRFGVVYRAKLVNGPEVAIKRARVRLQKRAPFNSELAFFSRLPHMHLVGLLGFREEKDERFLVYEYMKNRSLYDHLHRRFSTVLDSWKMRVKIALDASRGIDYLHNFAVPSIIHGRIKSANILLDSTLMARVSDFLLTFLGLEPDSYYRPMKAAAARSIGYMDPEYYGQYEFTAKSDVYGFGVVLLELLTGKRPIFEYRVDGDGDPLLVSLVDFAVPAILGGELVKILDPWVGPPDVNESLAVEIVAYTAIHCVSLASQNRPTMANIVLNLERALAICDSNHTDTTSSSNKRTTKVHPL
ncbi:hypothetical protein Fmac_014626 [Flemingia macrophylla]|uniref:Protein kinase domain-containing protein n=1 Tax=Flemingia macrophylla TaxID=520843 RepID=A0ABD1MC95_9FABA